MTVPPIRGTLHVLADDLGPVRFEDVVMAHELAGLDALLKAHADFAEYLDERARHDQA